ncbi:MAG: leucine-rich repeat protein [Oscillospiraceae bacterium]|nr:leucine-rich repeat protein [Oscillospiraceae bacterium]
MMKRNLAIITAVVLIIAAFPIYAGAADSDFEIKNGVLVRYNGRNGVVNVPETVTAIGDYAFSKNSFVSNVTLPIYVTRIGDFAFNECSNLRSIKINNGVTEIGSYAFKDCQYLSAANLPDSVKTIGTGAFSNCYSLSNLKFGANLTSIGSRAFSMCIQFTEINIPSNLASIGTAAFSSCFNLKNYTVSEENKNFSAFDGVLYSKDEKTLVAYPQGKIGAYTLREKTTIISGGAFSYAVGLAGITGTQNVERVNESAFEYCVGLRDIYFPNASLVHDRSFYGCSSLKTVRLGGAAIGQYAFAECSMLSTVIIGEGAILLNDFAFGWCPNLTDLVLPSTIQLIGSNVFSYTPKDTKIFCEIGSVPYQYFKTFNMICVPLPKPSDWAVDILKSADKFATANLQIGYKENATRYQFTLAAANFLEQYYNKKVDELVVERELAVGQFSDSYDIDVMLVSALGVVKGTGDGLFSPDALLTREQAATLMHRVMLDVLPPEPEKEPAGDLPEEEENDEPEEEAIEENEENEEEAPEDETDDLFDLDYKDTGKISDWALEAVKVMTEKGIMVGDGENFNPKQPCTREMCIIMFSRLWDAVNPQTTK